MAKFQVGAGVEEDKIEDEGFTAIPEGPYEMVVYEIEEGVFTSEKNDGKPRLVVKLRIPAEAEKYAKRQFTDFKVPFFTEEGNDWANRAAKNFFITGLGLESLADIPEDLDDMLGWPINVMVGIQEKGQYAGSNEIKRYLPRNADMTIKEPITPKAKTAPPAGKL